MSRDDSSLRGRLVFLVGARRSGTNWLHGLMTVHPQLAKVPAETHLFHTLSELARRFQHGLVGSPNTGSLYLPEADMYDAFRELCDRAFAIQLAAAGGDDVRLVERTPLHAQHLDLITAVYPDAPVVHLIRDGREVAASLARQPWGPGSARAAAEEWVTTVRRARAAAGASYLEVRHEELVADPVGQLARVFDTLHLAAPADVLDRVRAAAPRRVNAGGAQQGLSARQREQVEAVAGDLLAELGYARSVPAGGRPDPARRVREVSRVVAATATRRRHRRPPAPGAPTDATQRAIDAILAALVDADLPQVAARLAATVQLRVHVADGRPVLTAGRDEAAAALLAVAVPAGRQLRGDSYPGLPSFTVVWVHALDGVVVQRVFVIRLDSLDLVTALDYYELTGRATPPAP